MDAQSLKKLIADDEAKLRLLDQEADRFRKRVAASRALLETLGETKLDVALTDQLQQLPNLTPELSLDAAPAQAVAPRRNRGDVQAAVLGAIGPTSKHLADIRAVLSESGTPVEGDQLRARLWILKKQGIVVSDKPGFFRLAPKEERLS